MQVEAELNEWDSPTPGSSGVKEREATGCIARIFCVWVRVGMVCVKPPFFICLEGAAIVVV